LPLTPVNHSLGTPFVELQSIDSTNNYALAQIHANVAQPGTCYFAHEQTAGKGQRGKSWASEKGSNILLTIVVKPLFLQPSQQFHLSVCVAVAIHRFLSYHIGNDLKIKWPNDLYWKDRKLGGILIENVIGKDESEKWATRTSQGSKNISKSSIISHALSQWKWAVVGIGVNINQTIFPVELNKAVSLKQITGKDYNCVRLAKELCGIVDEFYQRLVRKGHKSNLKLYNEFLYKKDEIVNFKKDNRNFQATVKSVNENGQLIIQHYIEETVDFGQVEWIQERSTGME
jgi:BirA family biotin operon repressor/biotin-[acetyl-CoA-carboxylase] ligase